MGVYLRTSLRAGPFRFNLSRSGIGISVGVPGFRIGTSPRGNYVRLGKSSGYFATTSARARQHGSGTEVAPPARPALPLNDPVVLQELDGVPVRQLVAASPSDVVVQIQQASRRRRLWPYAAVALASLVVLIRPVGLILLLPGVAGILWLGLRDRSRRTVVVFYEVGDEPAARFSQLVATHEQLSQAHRSWIVEARRPRHGAPTQGTRRRYHTQPTRRCRNVYVGAASSRDQHRCARPDQQATVRVLLARPPPASGGQELRRPAVLRSPRRGHRPAVHRGRTCPPRRSSGGHHVAVRQRQGRPRSAIQEQPATTRDALRPTHPQQPRRVPHRLGLLTT